MAMTDANKIHALIVGIEKYELGADTGLDGPARGACRIAGWLRERGVPPENFRLHVTPLKENKAEIDGLVTNMKLLRLEADVLSIRDSITRELATRIGHVLVVYWCGHGFYEDDFDRCLFCSDASQDDWRNVKLFDLIAYLGSDAVPGFPEVIGFVDACAQLTEGAHRNAIPIHKFPKGREKVGHHAFVLMSSSMGQLALKPAELDVPLFTNELLLELDTISADDWLDVPRMDANLQSRFVNLRAEGKTGQTPSRYFARDWAGSVNTIGSLSPRATAPKSCAWLAQDELDELFAIIADEQLPGAILSQLYRNSLPSIAALRSDHSLRGIVGHLASLGEARSHSSAIGQLVLQLADRLPASRQMLIEWLAQVNGGNLVPIDARQPRSMKPRYVISVAILPESLVAGEKGVADDERRIASIRTWKDGDPNPLPGGWDPDSPVTLSEVNEALIQEIDLLEKQLRRGGIGKRNTEIVIEFCLPRTLLTEPVDEWKIPGDFSPQALGTKHPVIVRDRERRLPLSVQNRWRERWDRLSQSPPPLADKPFWIKQGDRLTPEEQYNQILGDGELSVCVAFDFSVQREALLDERENCLYGAWHAGIPAAIWLRDCPATDVPQNVLQSLLRGTLVSELPERIWGIREGSGDVAGITLVWDDPDRVPYDY
ncbi:hypothetical protein [Mesorhizobium sp. M0146]|uniref:VMAP-C domain-containing protein n=1 Tax=unclassified Mesorhizobium TaxID=325217 RepID=UPI003337322D